MENHLFLTLLGLIGVGFSAFALLSSKAILNTRDESELLLFQMDLAQDTDLEEWTWKTQRPAVIKAQIWICRLLLVGTTLFTIWHGALAIASSRAGGI